MNKPNNYDTVTAHIDPIQLGGHNAIIMSVEETQSKSGKNMIKVSIDFAMNDSQPAYFANRYKSDMRKEKKWPFNATIYIMTEDQDGNTSRNFKGFCTAFEDSNEISLSWGGQNWAQQFKNRKIGVVYGEEEDFYNDELRTSRKIRYFCDDHAVADQTIPTKKFYKGEAGTSTTVMPSSDEFMSIPDGMADGLPFN